MPIIKTVKGDLVKRAQQGYYTEIAHGCNCFCVMGAGIAPQIARAFPGAERADNATKRGDQDKLGSLTSYIDCLHDLRYDETKNADIVTIYNLYTQFGTGGRSRGEPDVSYGALESAFRLVNQEVKDQKEQGYFTEATEQQLLGIPMIGAGLAGGNWEKIEEIINRVTPDVDIELVIWDEGN